MENKVRSYLVFRVGREWYGIIVDSVIEVLHMVALNEVPGADILGMMTLREQTIKVIDLRLRFGIPNPEYKLDTPIVVVKTPQAAIGLVVSETDDVLPITPESITAYRDDLINGIFRLDDRLIFIIETAQIEISHGP